ncbi:hypothetical protein BJF85_01050 [Saccharomonospora sp. CUA-673]|uniref:hypothetical protein n=1 Tax=Saccharomonospora sp. CUA-673 TaxID=1904969 RepID=UPI000959A6B5|nr:hypothetical protein [Saccharomonospora sp. CUA-673]OLT47040.1 hypothetical protein BJF85_01050 [Saccharomonospora sp. CUA-673]
MISCAVVVPSAPLLVPRLVPGSRLGDEVRAAAVTAAARLPERWIAVGAGEGRVEADRVGTFRALGVDVVAALSAWEPSELSGPSDTGSGEGKPEDLPLPVLIAAWLREQVGARSVRARLVAADAAPGACAAFGAELAADAEVADPTTEYGLLVLGDGSARRDTAPRGDAHEGAEPFDTAVAAALAEADLAALADLDPAVAVDQRAEGRAPWQALAGFALATGRSWRGELLYSGAPRGVGYHVAIWSGS